MKKYLICCLPLLIAAAPSSDKLKTGQWEEVVQNMVVHVDGQTHPTGKTERTLHCVKEEDSDPRVVFSKTQEHCTVSQLDIKNGNFTVKQACSSEAQVPFREMTVKGSYTPENYKMTYTIVSGTPDRPAIMTADISAHYIGVCPASTDASHSSSGRAPANPQ
ncbi:MAG: DUF3617 family protein [Zymomonas mobilis subsp. pomaceae]|uniref:DUF3617 family protein n=1 Tax=Zymomonas mobilis subsp. pomaceae (strain ATCC 29192 / DSM 22645 / JCM 10191 / CCUG 17912 / NBRC 13757 / NCIMB 11200 / NRRL B-4491 / Barker I) TaxID=579138 RepID=F8ET80_ZYMMT|nr:DUF3617 family protein [Zymomonas mobilis]AEI36970.1 hypothetical protein Zymop_0066 [Zymomonas mobilis subsp. pomaceae ATCC 29192]MDX5948343.1 DUF3617 family protein [Zymomonas mobilis subsp. pomaceae]GEB89099.1 hypothetical protein ZMO02_07360 [Zymomonas mobilis subsp. pomaceae]